MTEIKHVYEVRPRKDKRGVDLISDTLPFGRLWYAGPGAIDNAIGYAKFRSRSRDAVIRVHDAAGNVVETHEHAGDFKVWRVFALGLQFRFAQPRPGSDNEEVMLSFYRESLLSKSRNRRNKLSSNHS